MKRTINLTKLDITETDLLEEAAIAILKEMARRSDRVMGYCIDRNYDDNTVDAYKARYKGYTSARQALEDLPKRVKHVE